MAGKKVVRVIAVMKDPIPIEDEQEQQRERDRIRQRAGVLPLLRKRYDSYEAAEAVLFQIEEDLNAASPAGVRWTVKVITGEHEPGAKVH